MWVLEVSASFHIVVARGRVGGWVVGSGSMQNPLFYGGRGNPQFHGSNKGKWFCLIKTLKRLSSLNTNAVGILPVKHCIQDYMR